MFWVAGLARRAARSSSSLSAPLIRQPRAPRFSRTCSGVFMPTMTTAPFDIAQLIATAETLTWRAAATSRSVASSYVLEAEVAGHMLLPEQPDALDLLDTARRPIMKRLVPLAGLVTLVVWLLRDRRSGR